MLKKLVLVQCILLFFQILLYFGCEFFQNKIHNVKRPVDDKIPFLPWTVLPYCFWFPLIAIYPLVVFRTDPYSYCGYLITMVIEIVLSVVCYLIYPTSFQRPVPPNSFWGNFIKFVYHGSYRGLNCAPSLHCSSCFLVICVSFTCVGMNLCCVFGEWRTSKTDTYMPVTDSSTGEVIAEVPRCTQEEVEEAISSAQEAFPAWSQLSLSRRTQMMFKWREVLIAHMDELTHLCAQELGKNLNEAKGDILKAIEPTEFACSLPLAIQGNTALQVTTGFDCSTYRMPLGVVAGIVPFNFPAMIPWGWMVPLAIATGNTVVLKAATPTPLTSMRMLELFYDEAGFPKGIVNLVTCSHHEADILLTDPRVKAVTFVGTTRVGKEVYSKAAANGKRVQAQCEAKNHALVLEDADLESTVSAVINSSFGCAGMRCMALPVVCVQESIADEFVALLKKKAQAMVVGCSYDEKTNLGPVVSAEHKQRVCDWIQKGVEEGAELVLDGRDIVVPGFENGFFVGPTIFDHVTPEMTIGDREIFGPVVCIKRVKDFDEGITIMNANPFANGSCIFTQSGYYARKFEMLTDGGMVGINVGIPVPSAYYPFSGNKDSFLGDQHVLGIDGYRFYTRAKTVTKHWYDETSKHKKMDSWEGTVERG